MHSSLIESVSELWQSTLSVSPPGNANELWKEHLRIRETLETVSSQQSAWKKSDRKEPLPAFNQWAQEVGIVVDGLRIEDSDYGLCLVTEQSLTSDSVVLTVPHSVILSSDYAQRNETLKAILENDEMTRVMGNVGLVIILAYEILSENTMWRPYLNVLPSTFTTPIFYSPEDLQKLRPSPVFEDALNMYRSVARQFVYFLLRIFGEKSTSIIKNNKRSSTAPFAKSPFTLQNFTFEFYRWCVSAVSTRINMIPSAVEFRNGEPKMIPSLIPFADFANHDHRINSAGTIFYRVDSSAAHLQLHKDLQAKEEVHIYYGVRTNLKFLLHNGFVPPLPNIDNNYELRIGMPKTTESARKRDALRHKGIHPDHNGYYVFILDLEGVSKPLSGSALWEFAKTFVAEDESQTNSAEVTAKARKFLVDRFQLMTRGYAAIGAEEPQDDILTKSVWRLKTSEKEILEKYAQKFQDV
jgi:histone-lysine N-methyltransferase SETD3